MANKMTEADNKKGHIIGTPAYANWRAFLENKPSLGAYEYLMYTDARLTGEVADGLEPYRFFNLVPVEMRKGRVRAAVALRVSLHADFRMLSPSMGETTNRSLYHGGGMEDELAALASLKCGVRFRIAGLTRRFDIEDDPQGRLEAYPNLPEPTSIMSDTRNIAGLSVPGFVLDSATGDHSMMPIKEIKTFVLLSPEHATDLVRAARLYQDALWTVESEPNLAWLMLVAAIETAANSFYSTEKPPLERLRISRPELVKSLEKAGGKELATLVADEFAGSIGATKKFVDFLIAFLSQPPQVRPKGMQVEWTESNLKVVFRRIYDYRSRALHDGIPFPAPMCMPPRLGHPLQGEVAEEKPLGLGHSIGIHAWQEKDTPILFHTFEYIARNALNAWWTEIATPDNRSD